MGLYDRGLVREGLAADLMVFDLARIGVKEDEVSHDGPNGAPHTGALPGRVLRAGQRR